MRLGESLKLRQREIANITMHQQIRQNIMSMLVPRPGRRPRVTADHHFERRIWRIRREVFVRIYVDVGRMIYREQSYLIEIDGFFQGLHETKTENTGVGLRTSDLSRSILDEV